MTEDHVGGLEVLVGAAQPCVSDLEEDLVRGEVVQVPLGLDDPPGLVAFVQGVIQIQHHRDGREKAASLKWRAIYAGALLI